MSHSTPSSVVVLAIAAFMSKEAQAIVINVPSDQPTIQAAVNAASVNDEVVLADGVYSGAGNVNVRFFGKSVTVRSANGSASCTIDCANSARAFIFDQGEGPDARVEGLTILDGQGVNDASLSSPTAGGAIYIREAQPTIIDCVFTSCQSASNGGAIFSTSINPMPLTLTGCDFSGNSAGSGGALYLRSSQAQITGCSFSNNSASGDGGAFRGFDSCAALVDCEFTTNGGTFAVYLNSGGMGCVQATTFDECAFSSNTGSAVYAESMQTLFTDCTFDANANRAFRHTSGVHSFTGCTFSNHGGRAVESLSGQLALNSCTFESNPGGGMQILTSASVRITDSTFKSNIGPAGSGLWMQGTSTLTVLNTVFDSNAATMGASPRGGGALIENGIARFVNCTFVNNSANVEGGGIAFWPGTAGTPGLVANCVFNQNSSGFGGGISARGARLAIGNSDFINNTASSQGGGLYNVLGGSQQSVGNSILRGNSPNQVFDDFNSASTIRYCNVQGGWGGAGSHNMDVDPMFVDALGPDMLPGTLDDDFHLAAGSPCIDAGNNWLVPPDVGDVDGDANVTELTPEDLDGNPRFADGGGTGNGGCGVGVIVDMGAFEALGTPGISPMLFGDQNADGVVNIDDLLAVVNSWGRCTSSCCVTDFDVNGTINIDDLLAVINNWT